MGALMEYRGDDVDQAINNACAALGVDRDALEVSVVTTGSAGFLGFGRQKAVIRVGLRGAVGEKGALPATRPPEAVAPPLTAAELAAVTATVARFLELTGCAVRAEVGGEQIDGKIRIELLGEESELLIGPDGQTLDAVQYLLRKMLTKQLGRPVILNLDSGDYRERRRRNLEEQALNLAAEVKSSGKSRSLAALGPAERRIVHLALQEDSEIRSRSVGDGLFKKVLIYPPGQGRKRPPRSRGRGRS